MLLPVLKFLCYRNVRNVFTSSHMERCYNEEYKLPIHRFLSLLSSLHIIEMEAPPYFLVKHFHYC